MLYPDIEFYYAMFETEYPKLDMHLDTLKDVNRIKLYYWSPKWLIGSALGFPNKVTYDLNRKYFYYFCVQHQTLDDTDAEDVFTLSLNLVFKNALGNSYCERERNIYTRYTSVR